MGARINGPVTVLPEWFKIAKMDALFTAKDVILITGHASTSSLIATAHKGHFPKWIDIGCGHHKGRRGHKSLWTKAQILKWWKDHQKPLDDSPGV